MADLTGAIRRIKQAARAVENAVPPRVGVNREFIGVPLSVVEHELALVTNIDSAFAVPETADKKDAERYRFVRSEAVHRTPHTWSELGDMLPDQFDAAIDCGMKRGDGPDGSQRV